MKTSPMKLITIVAEAILEERLLREIHQLGARGHTVAHVRGEGTRNSPITDYDGNLKIEALVSKEVAERILQHISHTYFLHYSLIVYTQDVEVIRPEKYT